MYKNRCAACTWINVYSIHCLKGFSFSRGSECDLLITRRWVWLIDYSSWGSHSLTLTRLWSFARKPVSVCVRTSVPPVYPTTPLLGWSFSHGRSRLPSLSSLKRSPAYCCNIYILDKTFYLWDETKCTTVKLGKKNLQWVHLWGKVGCV